MYQSGPDTQIRPPANNTNRFLAHVPFYFTLADTQVSAFVSHDANYYRFVVFYYVTILISWLRVRGKSTLASRNIG